MLRLALIATALGAAACSDSNGVSSAAGDDAGGADAGVTPDVMAVALASCGSVAYTLTATIGSQPFDLKLDTGSTTLGVASDTCTSCGVSPLYTPGPDAVDQNQKTKVTYGLGSWSGEIFQDDVTISPAASMPLKFGAMTSQAQFFGGIPACNSPSKSTQGIIGFAAAADAAPETDAYFDALVATTHAPDIFATELCDKGGTLWLGGYDATAVTTPPAYTPMLQASAATQGLYVVDLESIAVAGATASVGTSAYPGVAVDTGTTLIVLPTAAFTSVTQAIATSAGFQSVFGEQASWFATNDGPPCKGLTQTKDEIDAALPPLTLTFGGDSPVVVQAPATESYLVSYDGQWCSLLTAKDPSASFPLAGVLGAPALRSSVVIFDRAAQRVGFAPHAACE